MPARGTGTKFDHQIAGPATVWNTNKYPALTAVDDKSDILGPGRLRNVTEVVITVTYPPGGSQGQVEVESSDDGSFTGTWNNEASIPWTAANKKEQFRYTGGQQFVRCRCSTTIDGAGAWGPGAIISAKGIGR